MGCEFILKRSEHWKSFSYVRKLIIYIITLPIKNFIRLPQNVTMLLTLYFQIIPYFVVKSYSQYGSIAIY